MCMKKISTGLNSAYSAIVLSYWHMGLDTLIKTNGDETTEAGGPKMPFYSEAWDAISRNIYTGLQGESIMKGWMKEENTMITC